ncbi:hypothetical protein EYF80_011902 [Liparis tanakae]|uniref:Uncharacterized protein n=1 Tax=Liparis tanakae TaxID=230148 RepID=A0A4Z2IJ85_9TELE|nr:hypothetical protein EYF80_011902 [Liparis tanakae]
MDRRLGPNITVHITLEGGSSVNQGLTKEPQLIKQQQEVPRPQGRGAKLCTIVADADGDKVKKIDREKFKDRDL